MDEIMAMKGETRPDAPEGPSLGPDFWKRARLVMPEAPKKQLTVRLDADVVAWFKSQGRGYQTRMNAVLRSYYEAHRESR
jgi:uncharacterized protein (DUF4415 family)